MKIAVPSNNGQVDDHFGHCKEFIIFTVEDNRLADETVIPSPEGCGCKSGVAADLARSGVTHLIAGNMGEGAVRVLGSHGIKVVRGASGEARKAAQAFLEGVLKDSGLGCSAGHGAGQGHDCPH